MTNKQAVKILLTGMYWTSDGSRQVVVDSLVTDEFLDAVAMAVCALMREEEGKHVCKCEKRLDNHAE